MDYSKIKLVVSDMDGTLLNSQHEVSSKFFELFEQLQAGGIKFAVASGRQYYSLLERMEKIEEHLIFIAENGAIVMEGEKQLHVTPMQEDVVQEIIKKGRTLGDKTFLILCGREKAYIEHNDPKFIELLKNHYEKFELVSDLLEVKDDIFLKVTVCDLDGAEENSLPQMQQFEERVQVKLSGEFWIDFNDNAADKGTALRAVQKKLGISKEETLAFGDYLNDTQLLKNAKYSVAMENAHPEIKAIASHITSSNDELGVEKVLEKLLQHLKTRSVST